MIQFDEHIFQMGWNHQLVMVNKPWSWCRLFLGRGTWPGGGRLTSDNGLVRHVFSFPMTDQDRPWTKISCCVPILCCYTVTLSFSGASYPKDMMGRRSAVAVINSLLIADFLHHECELEPEKRLRMVYRKGLYVATWNGDFNRQQGFRWISSSMEIHDTLRDQLT